MTSAASNSGETLIGIALLVLFVSLYVVLLGARPLFIPDEVRYAEIAREMLSSGNWVVPRLNGLLYFEKPPLGHWLNAISLSAFGHNEFAARFASAVSVGVSGLTVLTLAKHFFQARATRWLAVFVFLTTLEVQVIGTISLLDTMFSALLNAGIAVFVLGADSSAARQRIHNVCAGMLFGMAFLTKGLLAFVLPCLILVPWLLYRRRYALLFRGGCLVAAVAVLVVLPWGIAIHQQQPDFWRYFIWVEHVQRFAGDNAQHKQPFYYFLRLFPVAVMPWFFLLPAAIKGLAEQSTTDRRASGIALFVLWSVLPFMFFSVASGKLITYILPCMVPLAVLIGAGLSAARPDSRLMRGGLILTGLAALAGLTTLSIAQFASARLPLYEPAEFARLALLSVAVLFGGVVSAAGVVLRSDRFRKVACGIAIIPMLFVLPVCLPDSVLQRKAPVEFLQRISASLPPDSVVITNGSLVRAVSWSLRRDDVYIIDGPGESAYGLAAPDGRGRFLEPDALSRLLRKSVASGHDVLIVCKSGCPPETLRQIPDGTESESYGDFFAYRLRARSRNGAAGE